MDTLPELLRGVKRPKKSTARARERTPKGGRAPSNATGYAQRIYTGTGHTSGLTRSRGRTPRVKSPNKIARVDAH